MKIAVFGASGKIGSQIVAQLAKKGHEVLQIGLHTGDFTADYTNAESTESVLQQITPLDAIVVSVGGDSIFKAYPELSDDDFRYGVERKLIAQIRLVRMAEKYLQNNGSITLTSGFLSHYPNLHSIATGPLNVAVDMFVRQTAPFLERGLRINVVSPAPVVESERTREGLVSADQVAQYYVEAIESNTTGNIYRAWGGLPVPNREPS